LHLDELKPLAVDDLLERRYQKFRSIAQFYTV
jgi:acetyl-CoA carboxylase carboxyl transferase subunit alpha